MLVETWLEKDKWTNVERDWNARTRKEGGWINESDSESDSDDKDVRLRKSKDEKINEEDWERKGKEIEERWSELKEKIDRAVPKVEKQCRVWKMVDQKWHDKEWKEKMKDSRRIMKRWRKKKIERSYYIDEKREYRNWCEAKRKRREISKKFTVEEWRRYFMEKLEGKNEEGIVREETRKDEARTNAVDQEEMNKEEFERQIARLKVGKAPGEDKLENEVWKYMPGEVDAAL
ncbi:meiotically up-regulated gene 135 protein-like [Copidosoma floridanum]|uniref:meiotically up-regulated gene 135 protein-like n=1 Tax=Copidosoma floridanum TaxID=29053 RepID=UPI000C6FAC3A|nr:meiotically up-regulated gene 135 protein-like [Copidosoma floridanum]